MHPYAHPLLRARARTRTRTFFSPSFYQIFTLIHLFTLLFFKKNQKQDFFVVYPEGRSDYQRDSNNGWQSFNAVGSVDSPKSGATECTSRTTGYCYKSCQARPQGCGQCDWTSCADDGAFTAAILDHLEKTYCIDTARVFATGYSNGGMMVYELGLKLTSRFAALVPGGGQPFVGHNTAPPISTGGYLSVLDLHGTNDRTCPGNTTNSSDGWNYEPVDNVLTVWADALGCSSPASIKKYDKPEDGQTGLYCVEFGNCPAGVDVVRCSYTAGHNWLGYNSNGGAGARLAWWFFENHPKAPWKANITTKTMA